MKNETSVTGYNFNKRFIFTLVVTLLSIPALAQTYPVAIQWNTPVEVVENEVKTLRPDIAGCDYSHGLPFFSFQQKVKGANYQLSFSNVTTEPAPAVDLQ